VPWSEGDWRGKTLPILAHRTGAFGKSNLPGNGENEPIAGYSANSRPGQSKQSVANRVIGRRRKVSLGGKGLETNI